MFLTISRFWCLATDIPFTSNRWMFVRSLAKLSIHNFPIFVSSGIRSVPDPRSTQHDFRNKIVLASYLLGEGEKFERLSQSWQISIVSSGILIPPASPHAISIHLFQRLLNRVIYNVIQHPGHQIAKLDDKLGPYAQSEIVYEHGRRWLWLVFFFHDN